MEHSIGEDKIGPSITPSGVVYLYGEHFVGGGFLRGRIELPCRGVKVKKDELAETAAAAAFIGLAQGGHVRLYIDRRRGTLGIRKHKAVFLQPLERAGTSPSGFKGMVLRSLSDCQGLNNTVDILSSKAISWRGSEAESLSSSWGGNCCLIASALPPSKGRWSL